MTDMKYDFDKLTDRRNTGALKWDVSENELPMWIADMDFEVAPAIKGEIQKPRSTEFSAIHTHPTHISRHTQTFSAKDTGHPSPPMR
jgi:bifunctional pyridoxal-dependent enzyme with beta-cystathionase and maltose regulon repressor activities